MKTLSFSSALVAGGLMSTLTASQALACGGFFCNNLPIDQSRERIVFAMDEDEGKVEAHVQIFYQGDAEDFAWIVPVQAQPEVDISTDTLFTYLDQMTRPVFSLQYDYKGECEWDDFGEPQEFDETDADFDSAPTADEGGQEVVVVDSGQVGAYEMVVLQATSSQALLDWLADPDGDPATDDAFDLPEQIGEVLDPYIASESYFLALKLQSNRSAGDITPIKFTYDGTQAAIPLVLTSIAATPDMRLQPFVFSSKRAVPDNYLHVEINEAAIDWLNWGSNYADVITKAANEAGGQAFATDFHGSTQDMRGALFPSDGYDVDSLRGITNPIDFMQGLIWRGIPATPQLLSLLEAYIPMPASLEAQGVDPQSFYNCLECYQDDLEGVSVDAEAFVDAIEEEILAPLESANQLFSDYSHLTAMTSSMSAEEMTVDPLFTLNSDMGDVSRWHEATLTYDCTEEKSVSKAPRYITLEDGRQILLPNEQEYAETYNWDYDSLLDEMDQTSAQTIEQTASSGEPQVTKDSSADNEAALSAFNNAIAGSYPKDIRLPDIVDAQKGCQGSGCTQGGGPAPALLGLGLLGLALRRRR